jgi:hypothetical protein
MSVFYGSSNSRYFLSVSHQKLTLFHEDRLLWSTGLPHLEFQVIGVGNNGCAAIKVKDDIYLYRPGEKPGGEALKKLSATAFARTSSLIDSIILNDEGSTLFILKVSSKSKVTEKIFSALSSVRAEKGLKEYELLIYDIPTESFQSLHKVVHPSSFEAYFKCAISRDFNFFVVGNPRRTSSGFSTKFSIYDATNFKILRSFELEDTEIHRIIINNEGSTLLEASKKGVKSLLIVTRDACSFTLSPPADSMLTHFGRTFVSFYSSSLDTLFAHSFDDKEICSVPLGSLRKAGMDYGILFNIRDHIKLLYLKDDHLHIDSADLSTLGIEVKRCEASMQGAPPASESGVSPSPPRQSPEFDLEGRRTQEFIKPRPLPPEIPEERPAPKKRLEKIELPLEKEARKHDSLDLPLREKKPLNENAGGLSMRKMEPASLPPDQIPEKMVLFQSLENLKLQHVMGMIDEKDYQAKRQVIEGYIEMHALKESQRPSPPDFDRRDESLKTNIGTAYKTSHGSQESEVDEALRQKIMKLLETLEERFIMGEINEASYRELKAKYMRSLSARRYQASPSQISKDSLHSFGH